ncbi:ABC transporter ATP-binding protein [Nonomuraea sp. NPDC049419]|uniref:ABC transporter ATP-binding protein n=1 Tax=Nonomuraea sp. NPDC049419 TaxID=3155772 RepID=UPI003446F50B
MMAKVSFDDDSITRQRVRPGTVRRIVPYVRRYRRPLAMLLTSTMLTAAITAATPLLLKMIIDDGIVPGRPGVVLTLSLAIVGLALLESLSLYAEARSSGQVGEGLVYDLRSEVFARVQRQPVAFFTRTQTGALVSRVNTDVMGARQAVTSLLTRATSGVITLVIVIGTMLYLSWQITLAALVMIPFFLLPAKLVGRRLQRLAREEMNVDAELSSLTNERFNVAGALLAKLYGRPAEEEALFARKAGRVRDVGVLSVVYGQLFHIVVTALTALTTALVYGVGGGLVIGGALEIGTLVAMVALLFRLYGPINQLSSLQVDALTALVSFDRIFEVLDLEPLVADREGARPLPAASGGAPLDIVFDRVSFRYPGAAEVSLASLEPPALRRNGGEESLVLSGLSFTAPAGGLTALVGPSGAGKTTITQLVPRLYDVTEGAVRIGGHDVRDLTLASLREAVGVVTQDAHMFHDTIRANLLYARPDATEKELVEACEAALIWEVVASLPDGLDTVLGDRGYRLSGGEKQRLALARLLLKSPPIVVLDEATAHLDSESEAAIQRALKSALTGRTSLVIAHRLSTVREADQILVVEAGRIRESGRHEELLAAGGLYAHLYRTQFAGPAVNAVPRPEPA